MVYGRIQQVLFDGVLDSGEILELYQLLADLCGGGHLAGVPSLSSSLPFCHPAPEIVFQNKVFCLTGKFVAGSRAQLTEMVESMGARTASGPSKKVDYLVIGEVGSRDWIHSTHGRKLERAVELRDEGHPIAIVAEEHWVWFL